MKRHLLVEAALVGLVILAIFFPDTWRVSGKGSDLQEAPVLSGEAQVQAPLAAPSTAFTYQGELLKDNQPYTGTCQLRFELYSASDGTGKLGPTVDWLNQAVSNGLFTVLLDFGNQFNGSVRYLKTSVMCTGEVAYTALSPLTALSPAPYSVSTSALRGNTVSDAAPAAGDVLAWNGSQWAPAAASGSRKYYQTSATFTGSQALTACASGYHMATLAEIFDTTVLDYASEVPGAAVGADSGGGPPYSITGWVRTGVGSGVNNQVGAGNCSLWTSTNVAHFGTTVALHPDWLGAATNISPWAGVTFTCNNARRVWCVQD
jgi:hypothetical protein